MGKRFGCLIKVAVKESEIKVCEDHKGKAVMVWQWQMESSKQRQMGGETWEKVLIISRALMWAWCHDAAHAYHAKKHKRLSLLPKHLVWHFKRVHGVHSDSKFFRNWVNCETVKCWQTLHLSPLFTCWCNPGCQDKVSALEFLVPGRYDRVK